MFAYRRIVFPAGIFPTEFEYTLFSVFAPERL